MILNSNLETISEAPSTKDTQSQNYNPPDSFSETAAIASEKESNNLLATNESTPDAPQSLSLENVYSLDSETTISVPTLVDFSNSSSDNDQGQAGDQS